MKIKIPVSFRSVLVVAFVMMAFVLSMPSRAGNVKDATFRDGQHQGSANGYEGLVSVNVTVAKGRIVAVELMQSRESRPKNALGSVPRKILDEQSVLVDAVSGATVTCNAVREATTRALLQAVGN